MFSSVLVDIGLKSSLFINMQLLKANEISVVSAVTSLMAMTPRIIMPSHIDVLICTIFAAVESNESMKQD